MRITRKIRGGLLRGWTDGMEDILLGCFDSFDRDTDSTGIMQGIQSDSLVDSMSKGARTEKSLNPLEIKSTWRDRR